MFVIYIPLCKFSKTKLKIKEKTNFLQISFWGKYGKSRCRGCVYKKQIRDPCGSLICLALLRVTMHT